MRVFVFGLRKFLGGRTRDEENRKLYAVRPRAVRRWPLASEPRERHPAGVRQPTKSGQTRAWCACLGVCMCRRGTVFSFQLRFLASKKRTHHHRVQIFASRHLEAQTHGTQQNKWCWTCFEQEMMMVRIEEKKLYTDSAESAGGVVASCPERK